MCELRADWWSPDGGAESPEGDGPYGSPLFPIDSPALFDYYGVGKYPPKGVLKYE